MLGKQTQGSLCSKRNVQHIAAVAHTCPTGRSWHPNALLVYTVLVLLVSTLAFTYWAVSLMENSPAPLPGEVRLKIWCARQL